MVALSDAVRMSMSERSGWQWERCDSAAGSNCMNVTRYNLAGRDTHDYTPATADEGKYLRAWVFYTHDGACVRALTLFAGPVASAGGQGQASAASLPHTGATLW